MDRESYRQAVAVSLVSCLAIIGAVLWFTGCARPAGAAAVAPTASDKFHEVEMANIEIQDTEWREAKYKFEMTMGADSFGMNRRRKDNTGFEPLITWTRDGQFLFRGRACERFAYRDQWFGNGIVLWCDKWKS